MPALRRPSSDRRAPRRARITLLAGASALALLGAGAGGAPPARASLVHLDLHRANLPDPTGDSSGPAGSDLQGLAAELDPVTGYALVQLGGLTVPHSVLFGHAAPDGTCQAAGGIAIDFPASGTPATWHLPDGSTQVVDGAATAVGAPTPTTGGSALEEQPALMTADPPDCVQATTHSEAGQLYDSAGPVGFVSLPASQFAPAPPVDQPAPPRTSRMQVDGFPGDRIRLIRGRIEVPVFCIQAAEPPTCTGKVEVRLQGSGRPHTILGVLRFSAPEGRHSVLRLPTTKQSRAVIRRRRAVPAHVSLASLRGGGVEVNRQFVPRAPGDPLP